LTVAPKIFIILRRPESSGVIGNNREMSPFKEHRLKEKFEMCTTVWIFIALVLLFLLIVNFNLFLFECILILGEFSEIMDIRTFSEDGKIIFSDFKIKLSSDSFKKSNWHGLEQISQVSHEKCLLLLQ
jgi:hypothetical protein